MTSSGFMALRPVFICAFARLINGGAIKFGKFRDVNIINVFAKQRYLNRFGAWTEEMAKIAGYSRRMIYLGRGYRDKKYDECGDETAIAQMLAHLGSHAETTPLWGGHKGKNVKTS